MKKIKFALLPILAALIMKYTNNCSRFRIMALFTLIISGASARLAAQEDIHVNVTNFSIVIETTNDEIKLTCNEGCAWKQLSFTSTINGTPQAVDEYGMTTWPGNHTTKQSTQSGFLFTIQKTQDGISLEGKEGTIWPSLTFDNSRGNRIRSIDEWGETELKKN